MPAGSAPEVGWAAATDVTGSADPQREAVYLAEDAVIGEIGRALPTFTDVLAFLEGVLLDPAYLDRFAAAPLDVEIVRRSRGARSSVALPHNDTIHLRDGSWNALTVLHELAHLVVHADPPAAASLLDPRRHGADRADTFADHGPAFVATELALVRDHCGFDAYATLRSAFVDHGVDGAA